MITEVKSYFAAKKRKYWGELNESLDRLQNGKETREDLRVVLSGLESESDFEAYRLAWELCDLLADSA